jgi:hypothetical protein
MATSSGKRRFLAAPGFIWLITTEEGQESAFMSLRDARSCERELTRQRRAFVTTRYKRDEDGAR